jgi:[acyl-carrier-protein] S-malonyltransferase
MGAPWRGHQAWEVVERAETALDQPLAWLLLEAPAEILARTREAQLAIFLTSLVSWEAARDAFPETVAMAGHSLGQLTALVASGALSLEEGARLVAFRAEVTQAAADRCPGRMAALLGTSPDQAREACAATPGGCWVANDNGAGQVVVSGSPEGVDSACAAARDLGVRRVVMLNVCGAFHTPLMAEAMTGFAAPLQAACFAEPEKPVVSNADARPYRDADGWPLRLAQHLVSPVQWHQSMQTMVALGADELVEVGPGKVLTGLVKRALPDVPVRSVSSPADLPSLVSADGALAG